MNKDDRTLLALLVFNALSAIGGGIALMNGTIDMPEWTQHTDFPSLYFPGLILMAVVGGSALIASIALYKKAVGWQLASIVSGVIMLFWILGEIVSIRTPHFLQVVYFISSLAVIYYTPKVKNSSKN